MRVKGKNDYKSDLEDSDKPEPLQRTLQRRSEADVGLLGAEVGMHVVQHRHLPEEKAVVHEKGVVAVEVVNIQAVSQSIYIRFRKKQLALK